MELCILGQIDLIQKGKPSHRSESFKILPHREREHYAVMLTAINHPIQQASNTEQIICEMLTPINI